MDSEIGYFVCSYFMDTSPKTTEQHMDWFCKLVSFIWNVTLTYLSSICAYFFESFWKAFWHFPLHFPKISCCIAFTTISGIYFQSVFTIHFYSKLWLNLLCIFCEINSFQLHGKFILFFKSICCFRSLLPLWLYASNVIFNAELVLAALFKKVRTKEE